MISVLRLALLQYVDSFAEKKEQRSNTEFCEAPSPRYHED